MYVYMYKAEVPAQQCFNRRKKQRMTMEAEISKGESATTGAQAQTAKPEQANGKRLPRASARGNPSDTLGAYEIDHGPWLTCYLLINLHGVRVLVITRRSC